MRELGRLCAARFSPPRTSSQAGDAEQHDDAQSAKTSARTSPHEAFICASFVKPKIPGVDGKIHRTMRRNSGSEPAGHGYPLMKSSRIDVKTQTCIERSRRSKRLPSAMPKIDVASANSAANASVPPRLPPRG